MHKYAFSASNFISWPIFPNCSESPPKVYYLSWKTQKIWAHWGLWRLLRKFISYFSDFFFLFRKAQHTTVNSSPQPWDCTTVERASPWSAPWTVEQQAWRCPWEGRYPRWSCPAPTSASPPQPPLPTPLRGSPCCRSIVGKFSLQLAHLPVENQGTTSCDKCMITQGQGPLLFTRTEFSIKPDLRGSRFF